MVLDADDDGLLALAVRGREDGANAVLVVVEGVRGGFSLDRRAEGLHRTVGVPRLKKRGKIGYETSRG